MTNPAAPTPSGGGMPKWLIILLVVLLVVILGCCGGFVTCGILLRRGAQSASQKIQEAAQNARVEMEKEAQRAREQAAANGGNIPAVPNIPDAPNGAPAAPATPTAGGAADNLPATKLPAGFPSDIPVYSGLTPNYSSTDKVKGTGAVVFSGTGDPEKVAAYYQKEMESNGWKLETNQTFNNSTVMRYTKDTATAGISVVPSDTKVMVTIDYGKQQ